MKQEMSWLVKSDDGMGNIPGVNILVFRPCQFQEKEKTNSGYKHNKKLSHGIIDLTFCMLQLTSSEVTVTRYDEIKIQKLKRGIGN